MIDVLIMTAAMMGVERHVSKCWRIRPVEIGSRLNNAPALR